MPISCDEKPAMVAVYEFTEIMGFSRKIEILIVFHIETGRYFLEFSFRI